jgi:hypothetical protein
VSLSRGTFLISALVIWNAITRAITIASSAGWYEQEKAKAQTEYWTGQPKCTASELAGESTRNEQMELRHFTGPICLAVITSVFGACVHLFGVGLYSGREEIQWRKAQPTGLVRTLSKWKAFSHDKQNRHRSQFTTKLTKSATSAVNVQPVRVHPDHDHGDPSPTPDGTAVLLEVPPFDREATDDGDLAGPSEQGHRST